MAEEFWPRECDDLAVPVSDRDHVHGSLSAPVKLVEYGDYECPSCLNAWPVLRELRQQLGDRVALIFRHYPQSSIHPRASAAAQAAEAAALQGKFWEMHDLLFAHQHELESLDLTHLALELGLEVYAFEAALERESVLRKIRDDFAGGARSGVRGTPTLFLNGCRYEGSVDVPSISAAVRATG